MAYNNRYYQYDTNPRKLKPEYEPIKKTYPKKSTAHRTSRKEQAKLQRKMQRKIIFYIAICFSALFIISYRNSVLDETHAQLTSKKDTLALVQKENAQLEANIESNLNLTKIEQEAKEKLGMQKLSPEQKVYVALPKMDHVEASPEGIKSTDLNDNWIMTLINKIIQNFK